MKRRDFLKAAIPATTILPGVFGSLSVKALNNNNPFAQLLANGATNNDHVLVLIQLSGGNDGLNMVIPIDLHANYTNARTNIAIPEPKLLKLDGFPKTGLHPAMTGIQTLFNEGKAAVVQSVGYPMPNFSHFRATDIWMSASDSNVEITTGWAGRYLNYEFQNYPLGYPNPTMPDPLAIQIGSIASLTVQGPNNTMGVSISNPTSFYNILNGVNDPSPATRAGKELDYVRVVAKQSNAYGTVMKDAALRVPTQGTYPANNYLADQLKIVARLIKGGLKTKVFMVSTGGFDTHSSQTDSTNTSIGAHATLLKNLSDAVKAFMDDCKGLGIDDRIACMTFSEFGRRVKSNSSGGTDHGAASPLFLFGNRIQAQVLGNSPALPTVATVNDNVTMQYDFRSIYATILEKWFCIPKADVNMVMLKNYQSLPLFKNGSCADVHDVNALAGIKLVSMYPNPFASNTRITFNTAGGHTLIQIFDATGKLVAVPLERVYDEPGIFAIDFNGSRLANGTYYVRFQNGALQQVKPMLKQN
jgi:uncharacterized protein (DUF1501 family)